MLKDIVGVRLKGANFENASDIFLLNSCNGNGNGISTVIISFPGKDRNVVHRQSSVIRLIAGVAHALINGIAACIFDHNAHITGVIARSRKEGSAGAGEFIAKGSGGACRINIHARAVTVSAVVAVCNVGAVRI